MNNFISNDLDFLSRLIKKLLSQNMKWSSDICKLFPSGSNERTFSKDWKDRTGLMDSQVKFLHECCVSRNLKIILIDLDDDLNCTIIGELEPLSRTLIEDPFKHTPPMILLRRLTKYSAGPGTWLWRIPEYFHVPLYKIIQLKGRKDIQLLYLFNKIQYIRMKTLVSSGMAPISDNGSKIWRFDKNDFQSDKIKEKLDFHFNARTPTSIETTPATTTPTTTTPTTTTPTTTTPTTTTPTTTSPTTFSPIEAPPTTSASLATSPTKTSPTATTPTATTPTATTATAIPSKTASSSPKTITETEITVASLVEIPSKDDRDKNENDDDDEVIFRRPGWKRKRPKFELENFKPGEKIKLTEENYERKRTKIEVELEQATGKTYKCKVLWCGKIFTSWAQFDKHVESHDTVCKYCYKVLKSSHGCTEHSKHCAQRRQSKPKLNEFSTKTATPATTSPTKAASMTTSPVINSTSSPIASGTNSIETIMEAEPKVAERPSEKDGGRNEDEDDDEIIIRRSGGKRKQPKFEQETSLKTKKNNKFDWILSQANDETYKCEMPQCGKEFSSWAHFDKHQNDHRTQCKDCYKIFSNKKGLDTHLMYCSERHKPKPKVYGCQICSKEFITELQLKLHVESAHQKKEFVDLAENLKSKIAESKRRKEKKRKNKLRKKRHEMVLNQSPQAAGMSAEPTADVIEISDDEDGEVVCKPGCDCVVCNGLGKYFCK